MDKRIAEDIARGWELLEEGDLEGAREAYAQARRRAENARKRNGAEPEETGELWALGGAISDNDGDAESAMAAYREAHARVPKDPRYLLWAAELALDPFEDQALAVELCNKALDVAADDEDLVHAILLKAEALIGLGSGGGEEEARELLGELARCRSPARHHTSGSSMVHPALGDFDAAESSYEAAVDLDGGWADGYHGLGMVYAERGDHARMKAAWLRVRELDLEALPSPLHMDLDEFERLAEAALAELPENARALLENVPVLIDSMPSEDFIAEGTDPRLLGLFTGVPLPEKSIASNQVPQLDAIYLFQHNLESSCASPEHLAEEIRITVLHETAHFFGLEDDDLGKIGLD